MGSGRGTAHKIIISQNTYIFGAKINSKQFINSIMWFFSEDLNENSSKLTGNPDEFGTNILNSECSSTYVAVAIETWWNKDITKCTGFRLGFIRKQGLFFLPTRISVINETVSANFSSLFFVCILGKVKTSQCLGW